MTIHAAAMSEAAIRTPPAHSSARDVALFLGQWLRTQGRIGAIAPSSQHLARAATAPLPEHGNPVIVELGPGTGPFTAEIQRRLNGRGRHVAVESNDVLADALRQRFFNVDVVSGDAANLGNFLGERGIARADVIVGGLPWALFPAQAQTRTIEAVIDVMAPQSVFTTFAYRHATSLAAARRFRVLLSERFEEVAPSRTVWRNLPPAFILQSRRPRL